MSFTLRERKPARYQILVEGSLDTLWEHWFEGMKITPTHDGKTLIAGEVIDQSALLGLLEKIHSLNLTLLSVEKTSPNEGEKPQGG